jgi:hypothetical protein
MVAGLYWNPVLAKISFTSTTMVTRARRWMVCSRLRRPMANAPPSPLAEKICTLRSMAPHAVSASTTSRVASASVGADSNTLCRMANDLVQSSGGASPRPHATTFGNARVDTSAHDVPIEKIVLTPLSVTRPMFWNATDSMQPGHSVEPARKQLSRRAISL